MYEIVLTRLLSAVCWYYLAFVSISAAMFGMTAGALFVQLRPEFFGQTRAGERLVQGSFAMALSLPLALMTMLAVPVDISLAVETLISFLLFSLIIAVPFFFSGVVVCLSLTKVDLAVGRIYFSDLLGAATGCLASVLLLTFMDAPSAIFAISAVLFVSSIAYASFEGTELPWRKRGQIFAVAMVVLAGAELVDGSWNTAHLVKGQNRPPRALAGGDMESDFESSSDCSAVRDARDARSQFAIARKHKATRNTAGH